MRSGREAVCRDCAGIRRDFACPRCGVEALPHRDGKCAACVLDEHLHELLGDGTGQINAELRPLATLLTSSGNPENALRWVRGRNGAALLTELATGKLALTHAALNARGAGQAGMTWEDVLSLPVRRGKRRGCGPP